jgi:surface antigen
MLTALRLMLMLAIAGAAGTAQALESGDWDALEDTAQHSLEYTSTDESVPWVNPDSGTEGTFTPVATHEGPEGQVCREYAVDAIIDGREEVVYGTACRLPDGSWVEANAEYSESDPPAATSEVRSGTDWSWIIRNIAISGGYCSSSFCVGGQFGSYYPSWYNPWGFSFSYWDYGRRGYYYPYYPYYYSYYGGRYNYPYYDGHRQRYYGQHRYRSHNRHVSHHRNKHQKHYGDRNQNHYRSRDKNSRDGGHSERARSRSRRSDRDRPTTTRPRNRRSEDERYASDRSENRRAKTQRSASNRSESRRAKTERSANNRSGNRHAKAERSTSKRSGNRYAKAERSASKRSGNRSANKRSGRGRSGGKRGARSSSRH